MQLPSRGTPDSAGWDFYVPSSFRLLQPEYEEISRCEFRNLSQFDYLTIWPNSGIIIPTGLQIRTHENWALRFDNRSSMAKQGLIVGATIVDQDYQGELHIQVWNVSQKEIVVKPGYKLVQGIFFEVPNLDLHEVTHNPHLEPSNRGIGGFGSTGR